MSSLVGVVLSALVVAPSPFVSASVAGSGPNAGAVAAPVTILKKKKKKPAIPLTAGAGIGGVGLGGLGSAGAIGGAGLGRGARRLRRAAPSRPTFLQAPVAATANGAAALNGGPPALGAAASALSANAPPTAASRLVEMLRDRLLAETSGGPLERDEASDVAGELTDAAPAPTGAAKLEAAELAALARPADPDLTDLQSVLDQQLPSLDASRPRAVDGDVLHAWFRMLGGRPNGSITFLDWRDHTQLSFDLFRRLDVDRDGLVSFDELARALTLHSSSVGDRVVAPELVAWARTSEPSRAATSSERPTADLSDSQALDVAAAASAGVAPTPPVPVPVAAAKPFGPTAAMAGPSAAPVAAPHARPPRGHRRHPRGS
jgi:hypothetical protein